MISWVLYHEAGRNGIIGGMDGSKTSCSEAISAMLLGVIYDFAHRIIGKSVLTEWRLFKFMLSGFFDL